MTVVVAHDVLDQGQLFEEEGSPPWRQTSPSFMIRPTGVSSTIDLIPPLQAAKLRLMRIDMETEVEANSQEEANDLYGETPNYVGLSANDALIFLYIDTKGTFSVSAGRLIMQVIIEELDRSNVDARIDRVREDERAVIRALVPVN